MTMNHHAFYTRMIAAEKHPFEGWDFSWLDGRWSSDPLPWDYLSIVRNHLKPAYQLLDMGTGGGEWLFELGHPHLNTSVTESYAPNIILCHDRLAPLGIKVHAVKDDDLLTGLADQAYDIVINRHESFDLRAVHRILKTGGLWITQQVGWKNNADLSSYFSPDWPDGHPKTMEKIVSDWKQAGFEVLDAQEFFPKLRFFDVGALVYFAKVIDWEFPDFSVDRHLDKLIALDELIAKNGHIESTEHRYLVVARKA